MNKLFAIAAAATTIVAAVPASATSFTFDTTKAGTVNSASAQTYSTTVGKEALSMKASAWTVYNSSTAYSSSLKNYAQGLGVVNAYDNVNNNTHTIDNQNGIDFVVLQFSQAVTLTSSVLNAFNISGIADNDSTVAWGTATGAWNKDLNSSLLSLFAGSTNITGNGKATQTYNFSTPGNIWLIAASAANPDRNVDGFKLGSVTAATVAAVPEPATWAMMLVGFGMVGGAARYRRRGTKVAYA
ncbi:PEPxxWA-CTERM sorting domain-containing protein [Sphingomonas sp. 1P08PE]|uniref:PEPxxWA-CTERM sorting domain-containing protein n=1 Tax=Sphingomonas sp. 1P08PE TaxID=554122 RepID=UPI0039A03E69